MNWTSFAVGGAIGAFLATAVWVFAIRHDNAAKETRFRAELESAEAAGIAQQTECLAALREATARLNRVTQTGNQQRMP